MKVERKSVLLVRKRGETSTEKYGERKEAFCGKNVMRGLREKMTLAL